MVPASVLPMMASSEDSTIAARKRSVGTVESSGNDWGVVDNGCASGMGQPGATSGRPPREDGSTGTVGPQPARIVGLGRQTPHGSVPHYRRSGERVSRYGPQKR